MEDSALNIYLDEIGKGQLLSDEEEHQLSERIQKGDQRALSKLVEANLKFVVTIARQYKGRGVDMEDLVSEGNIGLMKAAAKFDASKGVRFVNYAVVHVRQQMEGHWCCAVGFRCCGYGIAPGPSRFCPCEFLPRCAPGPS